MDSLHEHVVRSKGSKLTRIAKKVFLGLVILIVLAAIAGASYEALANWKDSRRFPQEGRSVALGAGFPGVSLSLNCTGNGTPTVILESGLGVPAAGWGLVQPEIAKFTRVCSYDRAGYGWSTPGPIPRTTARILKGPHSLLPLSGE